MVVTELNRDQLNELKQAYITQLTECDDEVLGTSYEELIVSQDIPDEVIFEHYAGFDFSEDDFFCAANGGC